MCGSTFHPHSLERQTCYRKEDTVNRIISVVLKVYFLKTLCMEQPLINTVLKALNRILVTTGDNGITSVVAVLSQDRMLGSRDLLTFDTHSLKR